MRILIGSIILVCFIALAATIGTIIIGSRSFEGLVVDKPYETGLAWDKEHGKCDRLGWKAALRRPIFRTGENDFSVMVTAKDGSPLSSATVTVVVTRPSTRAYDRTYKATQQTAGLYRTLVDLPLFGDWDLGIAVSHESDRCNFEQRVYAEKPTR